MSTSDDFQACATCGVERAVDTLDNKGMCPFCVEEGREPPAKYAEIIVKERKKPDPPPEDRPRTPKASTPEKQAEVDEAFRMPYTPPAFDRAAAEASPQREMALRTLCRRKFLPFVQRFRPKYMAGWVHEDICRRLERFMRDVEDGKEPRLLMMMPPRSGKLLADSTPVPTPTGYRPHGELQPGDEVFHPSGRPIQVLAISPKDVADVRVTFSDGSSYLCHENHEWTLYNRMRQEWQTIEAKHFLTPTRFGTKKQVISGGRAMYQLPVVAPLQYRSEEFTVHPYVLGAWLGDGSAGKPCITGAASDRAVTDKIERLGYPVSTVCEHQTTKCLTTYFSGPRPNVRGRLTTELQALGIYKEKRIPPEYQRLTVELRLELLAGLIDTDGTTDRNSRITFTTASRNLADDVLELLTGLGMRPYIQEVQPILSTSGIQGRKVCYVIGFQPTMPIPVALERKRVTRFAPQRRVGLVSVERAETPEVGNCVQVDSPDGLYVVGDKLTTTHNSELGSRHFPPWVLGQHPEWEIIAASHTSSLTLSFSRYIRDLIRDPAYQALFPDMRLDPGSQSVENWNTLSGGGYLAAGVGTGITGRGAHILLLDDLVKDIEAADSATISENTWEWYASTAYTRLAPGGGVLGIMTWWNESDWAGRIQQVMASGEGDRFEIIKYPAINEDGDEYLLPDDSIVQILPGSDIPAGAKMTRPHNTAIHPARYTTEAMLRIKRNLAAAGQKRVWNALYQQNPTPDDGVIFSKEMVQYFVHMPQRRNVTRFQAWDFAITENQQSDYTVCVTGDQDEHNNIYIVDVFRFRSDDGNAIVEHMIDQIVAWGPDFLAVEDGQIWKSIKSQFETRCAERQVFQAYEVLQPLTDKIVRAGPLRGRMQLKKVFIRKDTPWTDPFVRELMVFPWGKHDDQVDAASWMVRLTLQHLPKKPPAPPPPKSWKDKLNGIIAGQGVAGQSHMSA